jgi:hypothetical protein
MSTVNIGSALPTGSNVIGNVKIVDTAGTNQAAVDANNNLHIAVYNAANSMAVDSSNNAHVALFNAGNQLGINSGGNAAINLTQVGGSAVALGQAAMAASVPVTLASNQSNIATTIAGPAATDAYQATVFAPGELRVALEPSQIFYDAFDAGLDTITRWKPPTSGNGGVAAVNESADTRLGSGTTANGYSVLESMTTFTQANPGFLALTMANNFEFPLVVNAYRFWGFGTSPAVPTTSVPLTEAAGWELATTGKLYAVVYQTGVRVQIADLSVATGTGKQPQDANTHKYTLFYRGELMYWCIDSLDNVVATVTTGAQGPNINALPIKLVAVAGATPPSSNVQLQCNSLWIGDTARNNVQLSDGISPWRKATIKPGSSAIAATDSPLAVGLHPSSPLPAGSSALGTVGVTGPQASGGYAATVFAPGELRVIMESTQLFLDAFDAGLDTVNRWKTPTFGSGGIAAINEVADTRLGSGVQAYGWSSLESQPTFSPKNPGWLHITMGNNIPFPYVSDTYFFWGIGTTPQVPTVTVPVIEGAGWEIAVGGRMFCVMYQGGARQQIADLSVGTGTGKQPQDGNAHYYTMFYRGDHTYWCVDSLDNVVAQTYTGAPGPNINTLPLKLLAIAGVNPPPVNGQLICNVALVGDTTRSNIQLSDSKFPWRQATIDTTGNLGVRVASNQAPLPVSQQSTAFVTGTLQKAATVNGNGSTLSVLGMSTVTFTVTGTNVSTYLATVNFEGTEDGITWVGLQATQLGTNVFGPSTTAVGAFQASCAGLQMIRARISGYTGGQVTVTAHAIPFPFSTPVMTLSGAGGRLTLSASSLTANADNPITFSGASTIARRIRIQNESAGTIYWDADTVASTGSASLAAPAANTVMVEWITVPITTLHIWIPSGGTTVLNGTTGVKIGAWS